MDDLEVLEVLEAWGRLALVGVVAGVEVAAGWGLELGPREGPAANSADLAALGPPPLLPPPAAPLDDPAGFLGMVPVADPRGFPAEEGGELTLIVIEECPPKQTLSLAFGGTSPITDPPEVSSLGTGMKGPESGTLVRVVLLFVPRFTSGEL